jgi:ActR/RegA family two-component response regulator
MAVTEPTEEIEGSRPCLITAHADPAVTAALSRAFRRRGWDVYTARTGPEARRLARLLSAELVVLGTDLPEESGWLTCEKLTGELPEVKVFLVGDPRAGRAEAFAAFVGAAGLVDTRHAVAALVRDVCGDSVPAA